MKRSRQPLLVYVRSTREPTFFARAKTFSYLLCFRHVSDRRRFCDDSRRSAFAAVGSRRFFYRSRQFFSSLCECGRGREGIEYKRLFCCENSSDGLTILKICDFYAVLIAEGVRQYIHLGIKAARGDLVMCLNIFFFTGVLTNYTSSSAFNRKDLCVR